MAAANIYAVPDLPETADSPSASLAYEDLPEVMWELPASVADDALRDLHSHIMRGLRRDARHLPTGMLQSMQLERIAYFYILIRYRDAHNSWSSTRDRQSVYKLWRDLAADFAHVVYSNKISPEDLHAIVASHTAKIVANVLRTLPNGEARPLYAKFASALETDAAAGG